MYIQVQNFSNYYVASEMLYGVNDSKLSMIVSGALHLRKLAQIICFYIFFSHTTRKKKVAFLHTYLGNDIK